VLSHDFSYLHLTIRITRIIRNIRISRIPTWAVAKLPTKRIHGHEQIHRRNPPKESTRQIERIKRTEYLIRIPYRLGIMTGRVGSPSRHRSGSAVSESSHQSWQLVPGAYKEESTAIPDDGKGKEPARG
jgi:hypothetical protein